MEILSSRDGTRLALHHLGGNGPHALLIVHATGFASAVYRSLVAAIGITDRYRIFGLDLRGHGDSDLPRTSDRSWERFGEDVAAAVDAISASTIAAFGHSCGAASLLLSSIHLETSFNSLILYEPIVFPPDAQGLPDYGSPLAAGAARRRTSFPSFEQALENFSSKPPMASFAEDARRDYVDSCWRVSGEGVELKCPREFESDTYAWAPCHDTYQRMPELLTPTLILEGDQSDVFERGYLKTFTSRSPSARFEIFPDAGHFAPMEEPARLGARIRDWLDLTITS
jgi:pimeloyl-ACP methyl ester carboxylesterase